VSSGIEWHWRLDWLYAFSGTGIERAVMTSAPDALADYWFECLEQRFVPPVRSYCHYTS